MALSASKFQTVLDVVKLWYELGFHEVRVHGQLALTYSKVYWPEIQSRSPLHNHILFHNMPILPEFAITTFRATGVSFKALILSMEWGELEEVD